MTSRCNFSRVFLLRLLGAKRKFYRENCITCKLLRCWERNCNCYRKNVKCSRSEITRICIHPIEGSIFYRYFTFFLSLQMGSSLKINEWVRKNYNAPFWCNKNMRLVFFFFSKKNLVNERQSYTHSNERKRTRMKIR